MDFFRHCLLRLDGKSAVCSLTYLGYPEDMLCVYQFLDNAADERTKIRNFFSSLVNIDVLYKVRF